MRNAGDSVTGRGLSPAVERTATWLVQEGHEPTPALAMALNLVEPKSVPHSVRQETRRCQALTVTPQERECFANVLQARRVVLEGMLLSLAGDSVRQGTVLSAHALCEARQGGRPVSLSIGGLAADREQVTGAQKRVLKEIDEIDDLVEAAVEKPAKGVVLAKGVGGGKPHPRVVHLQNRLNALGHRVSTDGVFGEVTSETVKDFQSRAGMSPTGEVDEATAEALRRGRVLAMGVPPGLAPQTAAPKLKDVGDGDDNREKDEPGEGKGDPDAKDEATEKKEKPKPSKSISLRVNLGEGRDGGLKLREDWREWNEAHRRLSASHDNALQSNKAGFSLTTDSGHTIRRLSDGGSSEPWKTQHQSSYEVTHPDGHKEVVRGIKGVRGAVGVRTEESMDRDDELVEHKLTWAERKALPKGAYVFPEEAPASGSYPIHDEEHARAALSLGAMHAGPAKLAKIKAEVYARYPQLRKKSGAKALREDWAKYDADRGARHVETWGDHKIYGVPEGGFVVKRRRAEVARTDSIEAARESIPYGAGGRVPLQSMGPGPRDEYSRARRAGLSHEQAMQKVSKPHWQAKGGKALVEGLHLEVHRKDGRIHRRRMHDRATALKLKHKLEGMGHHVILREASEGQHKSALIMVDVQNDFMTGSLGGQTPEAVAERKAVVAPLLRLADHADVVVASRDWHPPNHFSFSDTPEFRDGSWPPHAVQDTSGAEITPAIAQRADVIVSKGQNPNVEAYSAFDGEVPKPGGGTERLADYLHQRGVDHVTVGGIATDYCVQATAIDSVKNGFRTTVALDASAGVAPETSERAIAQMRAAGVQISGPDPTAHKGPEENARGLHSGHRGWSDEARAASIAARKARAATRRGLHESNALLACPECGAPMREGMKVCQRGHRMPDTDMDETILKPVPGLELSESAWADIQRLADDDPVIWPNGFPQ